MACPDICLVDLLGWHTSLLSAIIFLCYIVDTVVSNICLETICFSFYVYIEWCLQVLELDFVTDQIYSETICR